MKPLPREISLPRLRMEASFEPSTLDADKRTIELRWYAGAKVRRFSFLEGPYTLQFSMDPKAIHLNRLNNGAPLKGGHAEHDDLSAIFGVIDKAWLEEDGGHAIARFSERAEVEPYFRDVQAGIIRNVSMEAEPHVVEEVTKKGADQREYLVTDWTPHAVALVAVGADPGAQALSSQQPELFRCSLLSSADGAKETRMSDQLDTETVETKKPDAPAPATTETLAVQDAEAKSRKRKVDDAIEADIAYAKEVKRAAVHFNLDEVWAQRHIKLGTPIEQVLVDAAAVRATLAPIIDGNVSLGEDFESIGWRTDRMAEALAARGARKAPPDAARQYADKSIAECAFECLSINGRTRGRSGLDPQRNKDRVVDLALHTTSDFPLLLANTLNKSLLPSYELASPTYRTIALRREFKDYRAHNFMRTGDFPVPLAVNEHGEYTSGTMGETSEPITVVKYGRILGITREILVNDDVGAFQDIGSGAGRRVADFENATFFTICILAASGLGPTMSASNGGVAVYNAAHANLTGAGVLSNALLGSAFALMASQTSIDGLKLNTMPRYLLVSPTSYILARTLLAEITPNVSTSINPFAGMITPIMDANLGTQVRFYVLADPAMVPNYVYGTLEGQSGPRTEVQNGFRTDGLEVKLALDFGCGAIDFKGGVSGAGS